MKTTLVQTLNEAVEAIKADQVVENNPDMVAYGGFLFIKMMFDGAQLTVQKNDAEIVFNAADDQEAAYMAVQYYSHVRFDGNESIKSKISDIAEQCDCVVL